MQLERMLVVSQRWNMQFEWQVYLCCRLCWIKLSIMYAEVNRSHLYLTYNALLDVGCLSNGSLSCKNEGKCLPNGFCECRLRYSGLTCEDCKCCRLVNFDSLIKIFIDKGCNELTFSCLNGGTCNSNGTCSCVAGFAGSSCQSCMLNQLYSFYSR